MTMDLLRMTAAQHGALMTHLLSDRDEAVAVALCGRQTALGRNLYAVREIVLIPHEDCLRGPDFVQWPTRAILDAVARRVNERLAVLKIHSHPLGPLAFSVVDDRSDAELLGSLGRRLGGRHLSAIMGPGGHLIARSLDAAGQAEPVTRISVVGDDFVIWDAAASPAKPVSDFDMRHRQLFGDYTTDLLSRLCIGIVGVSGTGSPIVEMLSRLGVGRLVLVDDDRIETKNLNRIFGSARADIGRLKVDVVAAHVRRLGLDTKVDAFPVRLDDPDAEAAIGVCDVVFGCVDSVIGRDQLAKVTTRCLTPYLDLGVRLDADGQGGIASISGAIHVLKPGGSSLKTRGVYSPEDLYAEYVYKTDPIGYADQLERGYIRGVRVDSPAVVSVNTAVAAMAVNELLARLHPCRSRPNTEFGAQRLLMSHGRWVQFEDGPPDMDLAALLGAGTQLREVAA